MRPFHSQRLPQALDAELLAEPHHPSHVVDLTQSNPTLCHWPQRVRLPDLSGEMFHRYEPQPLGPLRGREAVADLCSQWGRPTHLEQVMLTSSSSEAFGFIFKMACNPGETVASGVPGYPLVPHIAELEGLRVATFALEQGDDGLWRLNLDDVARILQRGATTLVFVSPGNPTGAYLDVDTTMALAQLCNRHEALAIFDEVFAPYHLSLPHARLTDVSAFERAICVGGLSKAALLPQAKVSWLTVHGTQAFRAAAMAGLEWVGDAFLSLGPQAQALPELLHAMPPVQAAVMARVWANVQHLQHMMRPSSAPVLATLDPYTAGWYAVLRPSARTPGVRQAQRAGEHIADLLLREAAVQLHPGYLFDLPGRHTLVASLIVPEQAHAAGWQRVQAALWRPSGAPTGALHP